jgi:hypothetical protein
MGNDKLKYRIIAISIAIVSAYLVGYFSIEWFSNYGWSVFLLSPFLLGFISIFLIYKREFFNGKEVLKISLISFFIATSFLLVFAIEGLICIAMAVPILLPLVIIGGFIGFYVAKKSFKNINIGAVLLLFSLSIFSFDLIETTKKIIPVKTSVMINAPIDVVWNNVVTFDKIPEPTDFIFKTGIAYPTNATIDGSGVGAIRYCNFTTGSFVEPITVWDEPNLLQFDVIEQPIPMNEFNPFWDIHPPHLDGYFQSQKGQFQLTRLSENKTQLEGTTWYVVDLYPNFYWQIWSDEIIHQIHLRVLNHIKSVSE